MHDWQLIEVPRRFAPSWLIRWIPNPWRSWIALSWPLRGLLFLNADLKSLLRDVDTLCDSHEALRAEVERLTQELAAIRKIARAESIEEALATANLTDVQRILKLTTAIASLRYDMRKAGR